MVMGRKRTESLSSVDVAWYHMEDPTNLMMITGVFIFDEQVDFERLKATLDVRFVQPYRRFRQRVVAKRSRFGRSYWEDDPTFDISAHLHRGALPSPGDHAALQELVSDLMSTQLDLSKPLWQFHLIDGYDGRSVLLMRMHHAVADGIALVQVMLSMTDSLRDVPLTDGAPHPPRPKGWNPLAPVTRPATAALKLTQKTVGAAAKTSIAVARDPEQLVEMARKGTDVVLTTGRLLLMAPDPKTVYKGKLKVPKKAAWSEPISLDEVKLIGRAIGGTVNDVLMSAAAGAMRRYLQSRNAPVDDLNFRAIIPVNLRQNLAKFELGNKFGLVFLSLPIGIEDPVERLRELKRRMDDLKDTSEPIVAFGILALIGMMPERLEEVVVDIFGKKGTLVMTNVPGPRDPLYLAGAPIGQMMFWVPQSGRLGLGISILSYNNQVMIGVATDTGLVPDPEVIVAGFEAELAALKTEMRQRLMETALKFNIPLADVESQMKSETDSAAMDLDMPALDAASTAETASTGDTEAASSSLPEDDLTLIVGIGPAYVAQLRNAGIVTYAGLAASTPNGLAAAIDVPEWRRPDFQLWIDQAKLLPGRS